jgi:hypothetical protein
MEDAGMTVRIDAIGNVIGRYAADPAGQSEGADDRLALRHGAQRRPL